MKNNLDHQGVLVRTPSERVAAELRQRIRDLRPGDRVPSARAITREWGVAIATATKVLATLQAEGLVTAIPGVGTIVAKPATPATSTASAAAPESAARDGADRPDRADRADRADRELIVRTAIRIADEEGLAALSMRRVGNELGVATMSLYRHVPSKDELVLAMIDHALGEETFPARMPPGWRAPLELSCRLMWTVFRRHPWVAGAMTVSRPQLLPNALPLADWVFRALDRAPMSAEHKLYIHVTLFSFVRGVALSAESETQAVQETGIDADQWIQGQAPLMQQLASEHGFTAIARIMSQELDFDLGGVFEFGLRQILDGVERNLGPLR